MSALDNSDSRKSFVSETLSSKQLLDRDSGYSICLDSSETTLELTESTSSIQNIKSRMKSLPLFSTQTKETEEKELSFHLVKLARKTGFLSLSGRGITTVPDKVFALSELDERELSSMNMSIDHDGDRWWDHVNLSRLDLNSNFLTTISPRIANLTSLTRLDLHNNKITSLPKELENLILLTHLNISHNSLSEVPESIYHIPELRFLLMAHNRMSSIGPGIGNLVLLEMLDISNNIITGCLEPGIGFLSRLISLDASYNQMVEITADFTSARSLVDVDLSNNRIANIPHLGSLRKLEILNIRNNQLESVPQCAGATSLREVYVGGNLIQDINVELLEGLSRIHVLELRNNKIDVLPEDLEVLQMLRRLDLSNNHITSLPTCLSVLPNLRILLLDGNPLLNVRKDILARGPTGVLNYLRTMHDTKPINRASCSYSRKFNESETPRHLQTPDRCTMRASMMLCYSNRKAEEIPDDLFAEALMAEINTVDLSKNLLKTVPDGLEKLTHFAVDINLSLNRLVEVAPFLGNFDRLEHLDLSNNLLTDLPKELSGLKGLRELKIAHNRLFRIPIVVYDMHSLEILVVHDNRISDVDVEGLRKLPRLATFDVSYNSIRTIPPHLGELQSIKSLILVGNMFKTPRRSILDQGTATIMEYLRNRIPK